MGSSEDPARLLYALQKSSGLVHCSLRMAKKLYHDFIFLE